MYGENNPFRKRFLGGFNQQDVTDYIRKLAEERNAQSYARDEALLEMQELSSKVQSLAANEKALTAKEQMLTAKVQALAAKEQSFSTKEQVLTAKVQALTAELQSRIVKEQALSARAHALATELHAQTVKEQTQIAAMQTQNFKEQAQAEEIERLCRELEYAQQISSEDIRQKLLALESAGAALSELDAAVKNVRTVMKASAERVSEEFDASGKAITEVQPALRQFQKELHELRKIIDGN